MTKSHFSGKLDSLCIMMLAGIEETLRDIKPNKALALFDQESDYLYSKWVRLPAQAHYTEEVANALFKYLRAGMHEDEACAAAMVPPDVVQAWLVLGKQGIAPWQEFYMRWEQALALAVYDNLQEWKSTDPSRAIEHIISTGRISAKGRWKKDKTKQLVVEGKGVEKPVGKMSADEKAAKIKALLYGDSGVEGERILSARVRDDD